MKKASPAGKDSLRSEYKRSDFPDGFVRGKYAARAAASSNIAVLEPDLANAFPNSAAVNDALRGILRVAKQVSANAQQSPSAKRPPSALMRRTGG